MLSGIASAGEVLLGWARGVSGCIAEGRSSGLGLDQLPEFDLDQFVVCRCVFGSRAYSLETDDSEIDLRGGYSDYDLRGAHVLPLEKVLSLDVRDETVQDSLRLCRNAVAVIFQGRVTNYPAKRQALNFTAGVPVESSFVCSENIDFSYWFLTSDFS